MNNFGEFGQIMDILNLANQAAAQGADVLIASRRIKGERKLQKGELAQEERMYELDVRQRELEIQTEIASARRRDAAFKGIALYVGIGLSILAILIISVIMLVGKKQEEQFQYLIEGT